MEILENLINSINDKTMKRIGKKAILRYERTVNGKIKISYQNNVEYFSCSFDCFYTLDAKYKLGYREKMFPPILDRDREDEISFVDNKEMPNVKQENELDDYTFVDIKTKTKLFYKKELSKKVVRK